MWLTKAQATKGRRGVGRIYGSLGGLVLLEVGRWGDRLSVLRERSDRIANLNGTYRKKSRLQNTHPLLTGTKEQTQQISMKMNLTTISLPSN
ncbi:MAG: hypothetical protein ACYTX0_39390 [Nostoc sp.]